MEEGVRWLSQPEQDPYDAVINFRSSERAKMLATISELIEDAQKRAQSRNTLSRERPKWASVAGKLLWYRDQILRSMNYEALWKEVQTIKQKLLANEKARLAMIQQSLVKPPPWAKENPAQPTADSS